MEPQHEERRLTTILAADVVGYSRLMADDEAGTFAQLKAHRKELIEPKTAEYHGRLVKLTGDGTLMEFGSVVDAVMFAVDIQRAMVGRNASVPEDRQITYRFGINIGDIIVDGEDIYGDGVNVAARLEALAEPGGICVSRSVHTQIEGKVDLVFEDLGEQQVKNIPKPVQIFRVRLDGPAADHGTVAAATAKRSLRWPVVAGGLAVLVMVAGIALWQRPWAPREEPASETNMAFPLPDKPSIAVLPFENMSGDPEQEYFADGIVEDIITDLSKISGLFVIARNSSFAYKGKKTDIRTVAKELGVLYVVEGSVRRVADEVRINAQLIEAATGGHLWAERYDGSLADVFALQDKVTEKIVLALAVNLTSGEQSQKIRLRFDNPRAYDAFLQGREFYRRATPEDYAKAVPHLEDAIQLDNKYGRAYAALAEIYRDSAVMGWDVLDVSPDEAFWRAEQFLHEALKDPSPLAHQVASKMLSRQGRYDEATAQAERAIALDANDPAGYMAMAEALIWAGDSTRSVKIINKAMRLDPHYPPGYLFQLGLAHYGTSQFDDAASALERATKRSPNDYSQLTILAATYGHLGRKQAAESAIARANEQRRKLGRPPLTLAIVNRWPFKELADRKRLRDGLRKVGVPEVPPSYAGRLKDRLTGNEIRSLLFGRTQHGFDPKTHKDWMVSLAADGESMVLAPWFSGTEIRWVKGDKLCSRHKGSAAGSKTCAFIFRNPEGTADGRNQFEWVGGARIYPFSVE